MRLDGNCNNFYCWSKIYRSTTRAQSHSKRFFCSFADQRNRLRNEEVLFETTLFIAENIANRTFHLLLCLAGSSSNRSNGKEQEGEEECMPELFFLGIVQTERLLQSTLPVNWTYLWMVVENDHHHQDRFPWSLNCQASTDGDGENEKKEQRERFSF